jgi:hypothetical protein
LRVKLDPQTVEFESLKRKRDPLSVVFDCLSLKPDLRTVEHDCLGVEHAPLTVEHDCWRLSRLRARTTAKRGRETASSATRRPQTVGLFPALGRVVKSAR